VDAVNAFSSGYKVFVAVSPLIGLGVWFLLLLVAVAANSTGKRIMIAGM
jgi:hypothetical protein